MQSSRVILLVAAVALSACSDDEPATAPVEDSATPNADSAASDSTTEDTDIDSGMLDSSSSDEVSSGDSAADTGAADAAPSETGSSDSGIADTGAPDTGAPDTGLTDTGSPDTGSDAHADATPADPCSPLPIGLTTWTKTDSASVGTPDTYFFDVNPGDPFCATITGGGSGSWSVNVSNGTSTGVYCSGSPKCSILVPPGQLTLLTTAVTDDIGGYTLTVHYKPR